jgi:hypothetical protein
MNSELLKNILAKSKEPALALLLAGGVWLAGRVDVAVAAVDVKLARIEARIDALERALEKTFATNP